MKALNTFFLIFLVVLGLEAQSELKNIPVVNQMDIDSLPSRAITKLYLKIGETPDNQPINVPVLIAKGNSVTPVLGLTAAIHGNELNGIAIIHRVFDELNVEELNGAIIAIPGLNTIGIINNTREYSDNTDLNRIFPGKVEGNESEQIVYAIDSKILSKLNFLIDMHTASFGRVNSYYARADMEVDTLAQMAKLQNPDIILHNKGTPSFGDKSQITMRAAALRKGIKAITVEYGDPQVYQKEMINRGIEGVRNTLRWLKMTEGEYRIPIIENICDRSYWIYTDAGGMLEVTVELNSKIMKGDKIGILRNSFGEIIKEYVSPEDGIVIGKSTNPVNKNGGRIIHLGILRK